MQKQDIIDLINQTINDTVPGMIEDSITSHSHNGGDSQQLQGQFLSQAPQSVGGGTLTEVIQALINLGLLR